MIAASCSRTLIPVETSTRWLAWIPAGDDFVAWRENGFNFGSNPSRRPTRTDLAGLGAWRTDPLPQAPH